MVKKGDVIAARRAVRKERERLAKEAGVSVVSGAFARKGGSFSKAAAIKSLTAESVIAKTVTPVRVAPKPVVVAPKPDLSASFEKIRLVERLIREAPRRKIPISSVPLPPSMIPDIKVLAKPTGISRTPEQIEALERERAKVLASEEFASRPTILGVPLSTIEAAIKKPKKAFGVAKEKVGAFVKEKFSAEALKKAREEPIFKIKRPEIKPIVFETRRSRIPTVRELVPVENIKATPTILFAAGVGLARGVVRDPLGFVTESLALSGVGKFARTAKLVGEERAFARTIERLDKPKIVKREFDTLSGGVAPVDRPLFVERVPGEIRAVAEAKGQTRLSSATPIREIRTVTPEFAIREKVISSRFVSEPIVKPKVGVRQTVLPTKPTPLFEVRIPSKGFAFVASEGETIATRIVKKVQRLPPIVSLAPGVETLVIATGEVIEAVKKARRIRKATPSIGFTPEGLISPVRKTIIPAIPIAPSVVAPKPIVAPILVVEPVSKVVTPTTVFDVKPITKTADGIISKIKPVSDFEPPITIPRTRGRSRTGDISIVEPIPAFDVVSDIAPITVPITKTIVTPRTISRVSTVKPFVPFVPPPRVVPRKPDRVSVRPSTGVVSTGRAFEVLVTRFGKERRVATGLGRVAALSFGAKRTRETLAATFRIAPTRGRVVRSAPFGSLPRSDEFRTFRVKGGERVPLVDTFIERRGKRLSTRGEIGEILFAKKKKVGGFL